MKVLKPKTKRVRTLRRASTDTETKLWHILRSRQLAGYKFRRQHPINRFIADFACPEYRLVIEADGGQHNENAQDLRRTQILDDEGWHILRFWNHEILENTDGVAETILKFLNEQKQERRASP